MIDPNSQKANAQRWIWTKQCMDQGVWGDKEEFRNWLFAEFGTKSTRDLTSQQKKVLAVYLQWYLGFIPDARMKLDISYPWRISRRQKWAIDQLKEQLGWTDEGLLAFMKKQLNCNTFPNAISKEAAKVVITGLRKTVTYYKKKIHNHE